MTTHSQRQSVGSSQGISDLARSFVVCPICEESMQLLTITHLRRHVLTMASFRRRFPDAILEAPAHAVARTAKSVAKQAERLRSDPAFVEEKRMQGERLAAARSALSPHQNARIHRKSVATFLAETTEKERSENSARGYAAAIQKYPDLHVRGNRDFAAQRTPEARRAASRRFRALWRARKHRALIRDANSRAAIDGRIPVIFRRARPTTRERKMISLLRGWGIPLLYVGDGSFRVQTPGGQRHWRNPDFINEAARKILLLDLFRTAHADVETADYLQAGWQVLRVKTDEMRCVAVLERKVRAFMAGV